LLARSGLLTLYSSEYGEIAKIEVGNGDKRQTFHVHKGLLSFYSGYFRAALEGPWTEPSSGVINLETEDPLVFERFFLWLYTNRITDDTLKKTHTIIIDLWLFADCRNIPLLMNEMINALHLRIANSWMLPLDCLNTIYMSTTEESALRRMLTWSISRTMDRKLLEGVHGNKWRREALVEVLKMLVDTRGEASLTKGQYKTTSMCPLYHVHEEGVSCTEKVGS
jgi:hypothetical protein